MLTKNKQNQRLWQSVRLLCCLLTFSLFSTTTHAITIEPNPNCTVQDTFPKNFTSPPSHFGACRNSGCPRWHAGVDFFLPPANSLNTPNAPRTEISVPLGCQIHLYTDGTAIWKNDPDGFGNYMFLGCGNHGGDSITVRIAHITGYNTDTGMIIQGRTGIETTTIPDHYHVEVLIGNVAVDPECVLGVVKGDGPNSPIAACRQCPNTGPANLCDASVRDALITHSGICHHGSPKTYNVLPDGASLVEPNRMVGNGIQGDPNAGVGNGAGDWHGDGDDGHAHDQEISPSDIFTGDIDTLYPPVSTPEPPPKDPPPSGTVGGEANLTPPSDLSASDVEVTGCAADTWTAMVNQAVLEARRETIINQRLIAKSDSVLTYTCFDQHVKTTGQVVGPIFSETSDWVDRDVDIMGKTVTISRELGDTSLDGALTLAVDLMAEQYLNQSFIDGIGLLGETASVASPSTTDCDVMKKVWEAAKCKNADSPFYTFQDLVGVDPRSMPASLMCGP